LTKFYVAGGVINRYSTLRCNSSLPDVKEELGHTIVHFLYTGRYETLFDEPLDAQQQAVAEFERSILVYCAASSLDLGDLKELARKKAEDLGQSLSLRDIQLLSAAVSKNIPSNDSWLDNYVLQRVAKEFAANKTIFAVEGDLLEGIGKTSVFDRAFVRHMASILTELQLENDVEQEAILGIERPMQLPDTSALEAHHMLSEFDTCSTSSAGVEMH
jgi:hypothetical protein